MNLVLKLLKCDGKVIIQIDLAGKIHRFSPFMIVVMDYILKVSKKIIIEVK